MMSLTMAEERQGPGLPGQAIPDMFDVSTGNRLADILMRITPEDGAVDRVLDIHGKVVEYGRLRDDWPDICLKAAEYVETHRVEIREKVSRGYPENPLLHEHFSEAMMKAAIAWRDKLLGRTDG